MKTIALQWAAIAIVTMALSADGRLNESETQCDTRYNHGQRAPEDGRNPLVAGDLTCTKTYHYQGWRIRIGFIRGLACRVEYSKTGSLRIAAEDLSAILAANGGVGSWKRVAPSISETLSDVKYVRSDGATALVKDIRCILENEHARQNDAAAKAKPAKAVPQF